MQFVGQPADRTAQRFKLLVQIGAQTLQFGRVGQIVGADFLVPVLREHTVIGAGLADRRRKVGRRFRIRHLGLVGQLVIGLIVHADLGLTFVLLLFLTALGRAFAILAVILVARLVVAGLLVLFGVFLGGIILGFVGILAQLITITQIADGAPRKSREGRLIGQGFTKIAQRFARLLFDEGPPQIGDMLRTHGQGPAGRGLPKDIARGHRQWRIGRSLDLGITLLVGLGADPGIDVGQGAGHVARAQSLAAGGFHGFVNLARHRTCWREFRMGRRVVMAHPHRKGIGGSARQQHLLPTHATADLRQAHRVAGDTGRIGAEGHVQLMLVGKRARGLGQGLLEGIGGIVGCLHVIHRAPPEARGKGQTRRQEAVQGRTAAVRGCAKALATGQVAIALVGILPNEERTGHGQTPDCRHRQFHARRPFRRQARGVAYGAGRGSP